MYKTVLLPNQMALDGSFPLELERAKPYDYSIFDLDAMVTLCQILFSPKIIYGSLKQRIESRLKKE